MSGSGSPQATSATPSTSPRTVSLQTSSRPHSPCPSPQPLSSPSPRSGVTCALPSPSLADIEAAGPWQRHDFLLVVRANGSADVELHGCDPALHGACDVLSSGRPVPSGTGLAMVVSTVHVGTAAGEESVPPAYWTSQTPRPWGRPGDSMSLQAAAAAGLWTVALTYEAGASAGPPFVVCDSTPAGRAQATTDTCGA